MANTPHDVLADDDSDDAITATWSPQRGARLLVADDDPGMRALLCETFAREGYDVREVDSGPTLLDAVRSADPHADGVDLIVADVRMPGLTGVDAVQRLRGEGRRVAAVLMTAYPDDQLRARAHDLGVTLLSKPFPLEEMSRAALRALLMAAGT